MGSFITAMVPMLVLFALPVLIPIVAGAVGAIADRLRPPGRSAAAEAVAAAQARSAPWRAEMKRLMASGTSGSSASKKPAPTAPAAVVEECHHPPPGVAA